MITPGVLDDWPGVARRVAARLRAAGASGADAEDLAAEAIARAVAKGVTFESGDHLYAWTLHVARNLLVDQRRAVGRGPEVFSLDDLDVVATADTATVVEHRLRLERALAVLATFSAADRAAVMEEDAEPSVRRDAVRLAVRRHRARTRLRAAMAGVAALLGWRGALRGLVRPRSAVVALAPAAVATVLVLGGSPAGSPLPPAPRAAPPVVTARPAAPAATERPAVPRPAVAVAPRPAAAAAVRPATPPLARPVPAPTRTDVVKMKPTDDTEVRVWVRPPTPQDSTLCLDDLPPWRYRVCLG